MQVQQRTVELVADPSDQRLLCPQCLSPAYVSIEEYYWGVPPTLAMSEDGGLYAGCLNADPGDGNHESSEAKRIYCHMCLWELDLQHCHILVRQRTVFDERILRVESRPGMPLGVELLKVEHLRALNPGHREHVRRVLAHVLQGRVYDDGDPDDQVNHTGFVLYLPYSGFMINSESADRLLNRGL